MNFSRAHRLSDYVMIAIISVGLTLTVVSGARAFTFEGRTDGSSNQRGFTDLQLPGAAQTDEHSSLSGRDGDTTKSGQTTFQFGAQPSFNERYNSNNLFDPFARDGR